VGLALKLALKARQAAWLSQTSAVLKTGIGRQGIALGCRLLDHDLGQRSWRRLAKLLTLQPGRSADQDRRDGRAVVELSAPSRAAKRRRSARSRSINASSRGSTIGAASAWAIVFSSAKMNLTSLRCACRSISRFCPEGSPAPCFRLLFCSLDLEIFGGVWPMDGRPAVTGFWSPTWLQRLANAVGRSQAGSSSLRPGHCFGRPSATVLPSFECRRDASVLGRAPVSRLDQGPAGHCRRVASLLVMTAMTQMGPCWSLG
jgi:hypothetical protein